ncbi:hypothetical protein M1O29_03215, partial [Dehalococcoidia bacterium]|nr:hypothetical protein [Dehalococcoidia bacterium]
MATTSEPAPDITRISSPDNAPLVPVEPVNPSEVTAPAGVSPGSAPTATPLFTPTPPATVAFLDQPGVLKAEAGPGKVYVWDALHFEVAGLQPFEKATVFATDPSGLTSRQRAVRADSFGQVAWNHETELDALGSWVVLVSGAMGSEIRLDYILIDAEIPSQLIESGGTRFHAYRTPEAVYHFAHGVRNTSVLRVAEAYQETFGFASEVLDYKLHDSIDFYLLPNSTSLMREVELAGAPVGTHEAGVSLFGYSRSGVYLDMGQPAWSIPHVVAHESFHQIIARIEGPEN